MASTTRSTRVTNADLLGAILGLTQAITGTLPEAPAVAAAPVKASTKASTRTKKASKAPSKDVFLTSKSRKAFVAAASKAGYDFEGFSTWECAYAVVTEGITVPGFVVGPRYTELALEAQNA